MLRKVTALGAVWLVLAGGLAGAQITPDSLTGLQPGDLLFKGADTATGTRVAAGWSLGDKRWGHVGIVAADGVSVIHADTGENGRSGEPGEVRRVPLSDYISDATTLGHYTIFLTGSRREAYLSYAEAAVGLPFDRGFSLKTETSLYCSELVWRALSAGAGEDVVPVKSERFGRVYVSVSDLSGNALAQEAAVILAPEGQGGDKQTTRAEAR